MWRNRTKLSWRDILNLGFGERPIAEVLAQKGGCVQVHPPAKDFGKFRLQREKLQARHESGFEFYEHVHIAVGLKVITED